MANVVAKEKFENTIYKFSGDASYFFNDVAEAFTKFSDNEVM